MRFKTIAKDDMSGFKEYEQYVIKDKKEWKDLWDIAQECFIPANPLPEIDFEKHMIIGVALGEALQPEFKVYAQQVLKNAKVLSQTLIERGFTLVSGGTDNHLLLVNLSNKNITGKVAEEILEDAGLTVNKNAVPFDEESRFVTGGIRLGTPAVTTRGLKEPEMDLIASWINRAINNCSKKEILAQIRFEVRELCEKFPLYPNLHRDEA